MLSLLLLPVAALAQIPQDGTLTVETAHYKVVFSAKQAWTIYDIAFDGRPVGLHNGFYGTVLIPAGSNFIGTGHTEGGQEVVEKLALTVDGTAAAPTVAFSI